MADDGTKLDALAKAIVNELASPSAPKEAGETAPSVRGAFLELMVLSLANFYAKIPLPSTLVDRASGFGAEAVARELARTLMGEPAEERVRAPRLADEQLALY